MTKSEKQEIEARLNLDKANYWDFVLAQCKNNTPQAAELESYQQKMAERMYDVAHLNGLSSAKLAPITDGVADIPAYLSSKPKIMWILKEPYDDFTISGKPKGGDYSIGDAIRTADLSKTSLTWKNIAKTVHAIFSGKTAEKELTEDEMRSALSKIAYINVSKMPAQTSTSDSELKAKFEIWKETLFMQIDLYNPDVIIFAKTFLLFAPYLEIENPPVYQDEDCWCDAYNHNGRILIDTYHPARKGSDYVNTVADTVRKLAFLAK